MGLPGTVTGQKQLTMIARYNKQVMSSSLSRDTEEVEEKASDSDVPINCSKYVLFRVSPTRNLSPGPPSQAYRLSEFNCQRCRSLPVCHTPGATDNKRRTRTGQLHLDTRQLASGLPVLRPQRSKVPGPALRNSSLPAVCCGEGCH
jgi:hypothetical protein